MGSGAQFFFRPILAERGGETWRPGNPNGFFRENRKTAKNNWYCIRSNCLDKTTGKANRNKPFNMDHLQTFRGKQAVWFTPKVGAVSTGLTLEPWFTPSVARGNSNNMMLILENLYQSLPNSWEPECLVRLLLSEPTCCCRVAVAIRT